MTISNGKWVKFKADAKIDGAHVTPDGYTVGIYQKGGIDGLGQPFPDRIMVVDAKGHNIAYIKDGSIANVEIDPSKANDLQPVMETGDIPAARMASARPDFTIKK